MFSNPYLKSTISILVCLSLSSCATTPLADAGAVVKDTFASDDPCSNNARNWGIAIGTGAGLLLGKYLGDGKTGALVAGAAAGALLGGFIGADMDRKRCELFKIAQKYDLQLEISTLNANGEVIESGAKEVKESAMGMTVSLGEKDGRGHFESDSDQLTPKAKQYFAAIADTYNVQMAAAKIVDAKERNAYMQEAKQKKLLLIGHTDDSGESKYNASLSERRARAVAKLLKEHGIAEDSLYFQGAGESLPKADNRNPEGRAQNRRVEIVEVIGDINFKKYLEARNPKHEYYRAVEPATVAAAPTKSTKVSESNKPAHKSSMNAANKKENIKENASMAAANPAIKAAVPSEKIPVNKLSSTVKQYDFGGQPLAAANAKVDLGKVLQEEAGFGLIGKAYADDAVVLGSCNRDRPRVAGAVKSLKDGKAYATTEYLTGLYNTSWHDTLNGNLVMLNRVAILSDSATPANPPEFKLYAAYDSQKNKSAKPDIQITPAVNTYRGSKGVLYRVFPQGAGGIQCMDVLFPSKGGLEAKVGKLIYKQQGEIFVADYKPKMIR
jgi:outer membrane protein OmpA-like peptidoglycan-associated protein